MKKVLIIGAMKVETEGIAALLQNTKHERVGAFESICGKSGGTEVVVCTCGIGKTAAAAAASAMLARFSDTTLVLNLGVAGGIGKGLHRGDIVLGERSVQHDFDQTADGLVLGQVSGFDSPYFACDKAAVEAMDEVLKSNGFAYRRGTIASGDQFVASHEKAAAIAKSFGADACDMETAAIAQVCALYGVPFLGMRAISDGGDDGAIESFYAFVTLAATRSAAAVTAFLGK